MTKKKLRTTLEIVAGEGIKTTAMLFVSSFGKKAMGSKVLSRYAHNGKQHYRNPILKTKVSGIKFENPVIAGAGVDKYGKAIHGLYALGFGGVEIGSVQLFAQPGNARPRLWLLDPRGGVALNSFGFNGPGAQIVGSYLKKSMKFPCPVGINIGKNKLIPDALAPWAHAGTIDLLYPYASYFVINPSSPNTPGLRKLQRKVPLTEIVRASEEAMLNKGKLKPRFIKISPELSFKEVDDILDIAIQYGWGIVAVNSTVSTELKIKYGKRWADEGGGLSGDDPQYRDRATKIVRHIYEQAGDKVEIMGVGGINSTESALERIMAGASIVQVVTAIRQQWGKTPANINRGLADYMTKNGIKNIKDLVGVNTKRGSKNK